MKEEKEAEKEEEEEVPEEFVEAVDQFYESADVIFRCFDDLYSEYLRGKDVREELKGLRDVKSDLFYLIRYILSGKEDEIEKLIEGKGIMKDKRNKIFEFKERYQDLEDEMTAVGYEEIGFINPPTDLSSRFIYDEELKSPLIEFRILSGRKEVLHSKVPPSFVLGLASSCQRVVKECLTRLMEKNIVDFEIEGIKESAIDAQNGIKEILDIVKGMKERK